MIQYTSGTTGVPKAAQMTHQSLITSSKNSHVRWNITVNQRVCHGFPLFHIGGSACMTLGAAATGAVSLPLYIFKPDVTLDILQNEKCSVFIGAPVLLTAMLEVPNFKEYDLSALKCLIVGGSNPPLELLKKFSDEFDADVINGYGMTESPMICQGSPQDNPEQLAHTEGKPVFGVEVTIVRPDGSACNPGEEGQVAVGGPQLFKGYKDPVLNNEAFDSLGRFLTGDLGVMREDGHVSLTGRVKDIIIRKGENISAKEIEDILYTHQKVAAVAVVGLPDKERGERVCAVVELAEGSDPLELEEMIEICESEGLMKQKIPEQLINYDGLLPRNPTLKILKYQLRDEISKIDWP